MRSALRQDTTAVAANDVVFVVADAVVVAVAGRDAVAAVVIRITIAAGAILFGTVTVAVAIAIGQQHGRMTIAGRTVAVRSVVVLFCQKSGGFSLPFGRVSFDLRGEFS